jgi:hypothetical protein
VSTRHLLIWITFLGIFAMSARVSMDTDSWWHLRAGEWMLENRSIISQDEFSYTRFQANWQYPGWLVEIPMDLIYRFAGPAGLNLWTALMVTLSFVFVWRTLIGSPIIKAFVVILAAVASGVYWAARPYLVTFLLAAIFLWILESYRWSPYSMTRRRLWWLPVLMVVWANSHGGFAVGFILLGIYWIADIVSWVREGSIREKLKSLVSKPLGLIVNPDFALWSVGVGLVVAVCINPFGPNMLLYPFKTVSIGALQEYIQEWQSPDFHSLAVQPFLWLLFLTLGAVGISRLRIASVDFLRVVIFGYMGFLASRNIALFALVAPAVITRHLEAGMAHIKEKLGFNLAGQTTKLESRLNIFLLVLTGAAVLAKVSLVLTVNSNFNAFKKFLPIEAVSFLKATHPQGQLFNSYNWGGYLLWEIPQYPVFIDGRTDLYNDEIIGKWLTVVKVEDGWEDILDQYDVHLVLIEADSTLAKKLQSLNNWKSIYRDSQAQIFFRRSLGESREFISSFVN